MPWNQAHDPKSTRLVRLEREARLLAGRQTGSRVWFCRAGEQGLARPLVGGDCARVVERTLVAARNRHRPALRSVDFDISAEVAIEIQTAVGPVEARDEGEADGLRRGI